MIKLNKSEQRKLFNMYKLARIGEMENLSAFYNTGNYSQPSRNQMIAEVKNDLLKFIKNFEAELKEELTANINESYTH